MRQITVQLSEEDAKTIEFELLLRKCKCRWELLHVRIDQRQGHLRHVRARTLRP